MEPTLAIAKNEFASEVGSYLGYGPGEHFGGKVWTSQQVEIIRRTLRQGMSQVVHCRYSWSWLSQSGLVDLAQGANTASLPENFAGLDDLKGVYILDSERSRCRLLISADVRQNNRLSPTDTGPPQMVMVDTFLEPTITRGQRWQFVFWPTADQEYTVQFWYFISPVALSDSNPYPPGGPLVAEAYRASCLAAAEATQDNQRGVQWQTFEQCLAAAKEADSRLKPVNYGYNADRSDWRNVSGSYNDPDFTVLVNGQTPT